MFKIGDEVMDVTGSCYTVIGIGHFTYDLLDSDGKMQTGVLDVYIAKYYPKISEDLIFISDSIRRVEAALNEIKNVQSKMFESVRRV